MIFVICFFCFVFVKGCFASSLVSPTVCLPGARVSIGERGLLRVVMHFLLLIVVAVVIQLAFSKIGVGVFRD